MSARSERSPGRGLAWVVGAAVLLAAIAFFVLLPMQRRVAADEQRAKAASSALALARRSIEQVRELEQTATYARSKLAELSSKLGEDPASTLPPQFVEHFKKQSGFDATIEPLGAPQNAPGLPGYVLMRWRIVVPVGEAVAKIPALLDAVASLEQRSRLVHVISFALEPSAEGSPQRVARLEISCLASK